tara:strand:- start:163 stop:540 length:378 start_codon:yes stop_codon:yes gene_type:complete
MQYQPHYYFTPEQEATDRNAVLSARYKIPSYALWRDFDIENVESNAERLSWWEDERLDQFNNPKSTSTKPDVHLHRIWIEFFKSNTTKNTNEKIKNNKLPEREDKLKDIPEYCSKRMGDYLNCDI